MMKIALVALMGVAMCSAFTKADGEKYLEDQAALEGVYKLPSGMLVKVLTKGDGAKSPKANTPALCHYHGTLIDGSMFDSSVERGTPITFAPNQVIKGWTEAMQYMCEGDKWHLMIPYGMAYGEKGRPPKIPAFAPLNFDIEIIEVKGDGGKPCNRDALEQAVAGELCTARPQVDGKLAAQVEGELKGEPTARATVPTTGGASNMGPVIVGGALLALVALRLAARYTSRTRVSH